MLSRTKQKYRRPFIQSGQRACLPLLYCLGGDKLRFQRQIGGHAEERGGAECLKGRFEERFVPVWRFYENLRLALGGGLLFQLAEALGEFSFLLGQVAVKTKRLAVHAGGHEGKQDAGGADERHDPDPVPVGPGHGFCAWISHAGAARFRKDANGVAFQQRAEKFLQFFVACPIV